MVRACGCIRRGRWASAACACNCGVVDDVVVRQRLLDHHQVKIVELAQMVGIGQRVGGVGVGHQLDGGKALAHLAHHVDIPAGLDLHLDALVAGGQLALDLLEQLRHGILNADGDAAGNFAARAAADLLPQRHAFLPRFQVPNGRFQAAARHVVAADVRRERVDIGRARRVRGPARAGWRNRAESATPSRSTPRCRRDSRRPSLRPSRKRRRLHLHQDDVALGGAAEAGLEEMHQRHADLAQGDAFDFHCHGSSR